MCLSSQIPDLEWESTAETVVVALWDSYCDARFVEVTLRPHGGKVRLWEVRESVGEGRQGAAPAELHRAALQLPQRHAAGETADEPPDTHDTRRADV